MSVQYWIGGFFIDLSRNQITQNGQSQTLAPKALSVLTHLAENQGKVVSQDALLDKVWQDTTVSLNTLQKSIAQLRKALGDSGNVYIKTHAKQGYSLECDVRWDSNNGAIQSYDDTRITEPAMAQPKERNQQSNPYQTFDTPKSRHFRLVVAVIFSAIVALGLWSYHYQNSEGVAKLTFNQLSLLTATDDKEFDATYSPDGQYIVFHRYLDKQCVNKIWAKHIESQQEILLTENWGAYGKHSFSPDGGQLVFLATGPCAPPKDQPIYQQVSQKDCYDLVSLNFHKALTTPQQPKIILSCKNSNVKKPIWLNDGDIALMQSYADKWKIIRYSPERGESAELYKPSAGNIIDYVYSKSDDIFAVSRFHSDGKQYIELVEPSGTLTSSHPIQRPEEIAKYRPLYPNFDPLNRQLVFSTGRQLFSLSYQGKVAKIDLPFSDRMALPEFHPNGKRMLMIKGPYDSDIVKISRESETQTTPQEIKNYSSFERTNLGEDYALFQPGGNLIAFWSERSGEQQVWVSDGTNSQKLTNFPMDTYINGIDWSADGESILVNGNGILHRVTLDLRQEVLSLLHPVIFLYQWDSRNDTALLLLRINGRPKAVEYNLLNNSYRELSDSPVLWAQKSDSGEVIVKDYFGQYWRPGAVEPRRITALANQTSKSKSFLIAGDIIYSVNKENQIWSYDLRQNKYKIDAQLNSSVDSLNDVNDNEYLITIQAAAKKEVVELSHTD